MNFGNWKIAPDQASNFAKPHDLLFFTISGLAVIFSLIVFIMVGVFVVRYRRGTNVDRTNPVHDNHKLEMAFLLVPTLLGLMMFAWSSKIYIDMRTPPKNAYEVFVIGKQWMWHIQHPNGTRENNELTIPVGQPIKLTMISQDVIHAFYLPEMRVQYHVVPGRYTQLWFTPIKTGTFHLFCTIHCGTQHSEMGGYVYVKTPQEFSEWLSTGGNRFKPIPKTLVEQGKFWFQDQGCANCHGDKDTPQGPALAGIFGKQRQLEDGGTVVADETYLRESIINPYARIVKGYRNTMPVYEYKKQVNEEQLLAMIEYIRSIGGGSSQLMTSLPATSTNQGRQAR